MAILITGGTGLLGPVVAEQLLNKTKDKIVLYDKEKKEIDFLKKYKDSIEVITGDITNFDKLLKLCEQKNIRKIVHLAAIADVDVAEENPLLACEVNVRGTYNVLEACRKLKLEKIVYASTGAVYGKTEGPVSEETPFNPAAIYGATKVMGETVAIRYNKSFGINVIINRLYFLYGPRMFFEPISPFGMVKNAVEGKKSVFEKGGDQLFEFTNVKDAAQGIVLSLNAESDKLSTRIFNISYGKTIKLSDFAEIIKNYIPNADIELGPGDLGLPRGFPLDIRKAKKELGFQPNVSFDDGVKETIDWLREKK